MNVNVLVEAQADLFQRTRADEYLVNVNVIREDQGDVLQEIEQSLGAMKQRNGKNGACIICLQPIADVGEAEVIGGLLETEFTFRVLEDPIVNRGANGTGLRALAICRRLVALHHFYHPRGVMGVFTAKNPAIVPVEDGLAPVGYEVRFSATEDYFAETIRVATPTITAAGSVAPQNVTLGCATAGAAIYYTLDGSHPWSGNAAASLYGAPFEIAAAATLRVGAFKNGLIASDVNAKEFTAA